MISVFVRTLNEEVNLPRCLAALSWCSDIVVVDSGSTDRTLPIAGAMGARVVLRRMEHEAEHLNWISDNVELRFPWVYYCDADEIVTPELRDELLRVTADPTRLEVAYRVRFRTMFMGKWVRYSSLYPTWVLRLFRRGCVRWQREVNTTCQVNGIEGRLREHFLHYSFSKGLNAWFDKHNAYSWREAREVQRNTDKTFRAGALLSADPVERRRALKDLSFRLPFRPALRFIYMYLLRLGFLDGVAGFRYSQLLAIYEAMIDLKLRELRSQSEGEPL
jgi:glycosyltransferase involved in cell wall biosynthesis